MLHNLCSPAGARWTSMRGHCWRPDVRHLSIIGWCDCPDLPGNAVVAQCGGQAAGFPRQLLLLLQPQHGHGLSIWHARWCSMCQCYRDKPYGQLVLVSLTHYCASTPSLSTSWSRTALQGAQGSGKSHLKASFPLRCFQRLSLPNIATRQCHWRDNRYTRGSSTPVLSY